MSSDGRLQVSVCHGAQLVLLFVGFFLGGGGGTVPGDQMVDCRGLIVKVPSWLCCLFVGLVDCVSDDQLQWSDCQGARLVALFVCVQDRPCSL